MPGITKLANTHFWLHNLGLPIMQGALFFQLLTGNESLVVAMIIGSIMLVVGVILFMIQSIFSNTNTYLCFEVESELLKM